MVDKTEPTLRSPGVPHNNEPPTNKRPAKARIPNVEKTYSDGLREGKLKALEDKQAAQGATIEKHGERLTAQERITYGLLGALALLQIVPIVQSMVA